MLMIPSCWSRTCARAQVLDQPGIGARGHEADVLAVGLGGDRQGEARGESARLGLAHAAQGEAQEGELLPRRREEEIALIALGIGGAVQLGTVRPEDAPRIM